MSHRQVCLGSRAEARPLDVIILLRVVTVGGLSGVFGVARTQLVSHFKDQRSGGWE